MSNEATLREAFEAWAKREQVNICLDRMPEDDANHPGKYSDYDARLAWNAWSAALAQPSAPQAAISDDDCIDLAVALEQQRALAIVSAVTALEIGQGTTSFAAGFNLACEEVAHRLKTEQWELGGVPSPKPSAPQDAALALPTEQVAVPSDEWQRGYTEGYGDGFRSVVPDPNATHKTKLLAAAPAAPEGDKDATWAECKYWRCVPITYASQHDILLYVDNPPTGKYLPGYRDVALYTADQMKAYARAAIAASQKQEPTT